MIKTVSIIDDYESLTIANEMKNTPQAWIDTPRETTTEEFEFEIIDTEKL